jgi:hypothetical protein
MHVHEVSMIQHTHIFFCFFFSSFALIYVLDEGEVQSKNKKKRRKRSTTKSCPQLIFFCFLTSFSAKYTMNSLSKWKIKKNKKYQKENNILEEIDYVIKKKEGATRYLLRERVACDVSSRAG